MNIFNLSKALQHKVFDAYFAKSGIGYTVGRVPMASCDFSTHVYSYDDHEGDFKLEKFQLTAEDLKLKIPGKCLICFKLCHNLCLHVPFSSTKK